MTDQDPHKELKCRLPDAKEEDDLAELLANRGEAAVLFLGDDVFELPRGEARDPKDFGWSDPTGSVALRRIGAFVPLGAREKQEVVGAGKPGDYRGAAENAFYFQPVIDRPVTLRLYRRAEVLDHEEAVHREGLRSAIERLPADVLTDRSSAPS